MSRLVSQLLLAILLLPCSALVYVMSYFWSDNYTSATPVICHAVAAAITWIFGGIYWFSLWHTSVQWNSFRIFGTLGLILCAALLAALIHVLLRFSMPEWEDRIPALVGFASAPLVWGIGTIFLWRESRSERRDRLRRVRAGGVICPVCGYDLTGLSEIRCPECGTRFTLDELLVAQPAAQSRELES